jgi:hypothetical protein
VEPCHYTELDGVCVFHLSIYLALVCATSPDWNKLGKKLIYSHIFTIFSIGGKISTSCYMRMESRTLFGITKNCHNVTVHLFVRKVIKLISLLTVIINCIQNLSDIALSRVTAYLHKITGDHQCEFSCNRSTTAFVSIRKTNGRKADL